MQLGTLHPVRAGSTVGRLFSQLHCGAHRDVVHCPFEWLYHRCLCSCRDCTLRWQTALTLPAGVFASRCRVVVDVSWWCLRFCLGQCDADDWKILLLISSFKRTSGVLALRLLLRECSRRDVEWWWFYSWWCLRFSLEQCEADDWKFIFLFPVSRGRWVCWHAELLVQQL